MAVPVGPSSSGLAFGVPRALFRIPLRHSIGISSRDYAVSRDGQRFLVLEWYGRAIASPIVLVVGSPGPGGAKP
jgi:hypothetical protein